MPQYSLESLSGFEFERLVRDLLQAEMGIPLQSGPPGPDGGVDLRCTLNGQLIVVQCKHYARSGVATLLRRLEGEIPKVRQISPARYLVATSLSLSHAARTSICGMFVPFCQSEHDVFGADDIEQLLLKHPVIADSHIKLWLTSEPVLRRILHSRVFDDAELEMERVRRQLSRFVVNPSLRRAQEVLEREHVCVIAGLPGIGKTTLAQVLLTRYEAQGYEVIRVPNHLSQITGVARRGAKVIYFFDDFLGQTMLERRERNEDQRLVEFLEAVRHEANWRFVLTTREYILEEARITSEALSRFSLEGRTCVITLEQDYTPVVRARILYQHLYCSDLPEEHTLALLASGFLPQILSHRNYSPRLISLLTSQAHTASPDPQAYAREFLATFNNPQRLWAVAFRAMEPSVQDLALVMTAMPNNVRLAHVRQAYESFRAHRAARLNAGRRSDEFADALRVLDGTMLRTRRIRAEIIVSFHNPSVRDFLQGRLESHDEDVTDLLGSAVYLDQCISLFQGSGRAPYAGVIAEADLFVATVSRLHDTEGIHVVVQDDMSWAMHQHTSHARTSSESVALFVFDVARILPSEASRALSERHFQLVANGAGEDAHSDSWSASVLLQHVYLEHARRIGSDIVRGTDGEETTLAAVLLDRVIEAALEGEDEATMKSMARLTADLPELHTPARLAAARAAITAYGEFMTSAYFSPESPELYSDAAAAVEEAAGWLDHDVSSIAQELRDRAERVEREGPDEGEPDHDQSEERGTGFDSMALFARLEGELRVRKS